MIVIQNTGPGKLSLNDGGTCKNCHEPEVFHRNGRCLTEDQLDEIEKLRNAWHAIVDPARKLKTSALRGKTLSDRHAAGKKQQELANNLVDVAFDAYQAAFDYANEKAKDQLTERPIGT